MAAKNCGLLIILPTVACVGAVAPARAGGPGFDCRKAATPVERLLCADAALGTLDAKLADALRRALSRPGADRDATLAAQRRWLARRDEDCPVAEKPDDDARAQIVNCLANSYKRQVEVLSFPETPGGICLKIVDRLRGLVETGSRDAGAKSTPGDSLLDFLTQTSAGGVSVSKPLFDVDDATNAAQWKARVARLRPSFTLDDKLLKALTGDTMGALSLYRLPGSSIYAANSIQGTAACNDTTFFDAAGGRARRVDGPASFEADDGGGCGVRREFGAIDGAASIIEDSSDYSPSMSSSLSITRRAGDRWAPTCEIEFRFAPRFMPGKTLNDWIEPADACKGEACADLLAAAAGLAEATQKQGPGIEASALGALTPAQREAYAALKKNADPPAPDDDAGSAKTGPDDFTDGHPVLAPLVARGKVYLASVGHFTIGWRLFADWKVALQEADGDALKDAGQFAIGMGRGQLLDAQVK